MFGWSGQLLRIDLTRKTAETEHIPSELLTRFIGGRGLAGHYLRDLVTLPFTDPESPFIIFSGPLGGTLAPTSGRFTIMGRSPLTGTIGDSSTGGDLGLELKKGGVDGVIITGRADRLTGITIRDREVTFEDATPLLGKTTAEIFDALSSKRSVTTTGPAADNGVLFAGLVTDRGHFAGRNGLGTLLASKNCKFIAAEGTGKIDVADRALLLSAREEVLRLSSASPILMGELGITNWGTGALYDLMHVRRMMPTRNFRETWFEKAPRMNAYFYKKKFAPKKGGCRGCHIQCKKLVEEKHIPEFETMSHFSALIDNDDLDTIMEANHLCGLMGMDTISMGGTLACHLEIAAEKPSREQILAMVHDTALGRGLGRELGQGAARYAQSKGSPELAMAVKGQELPAYDPRGAYGMALAYATSTRGGCHLRAYPIAHEILRKPVATDRFSFSSKARIIKLAEDANAVVDSLTACKFLFLATSLEEYSRVFEGVTGVPLTTHELMVCGERILYNERIMNAQNGFNATHDTLPQRFFAEEGSSGNAITVLPLDRAAFEETRARYYTIRGLTPEGLPTPEKAVALNLEPLPARES